MNKFDSFSILHLMTYLEAKKRTLIPKSTDDIIFWEDLKQILELSNFNHIMNPKTK